MSKTGIKRAVKLTRGRLIRIVALFDLLNAMWKTGLITSHEHFDYWEYLEEQVVSQFGIEKYNEYVEYMGENLFYV